MEENEGDYSCSVCDGKALNVDIDIYGSGETIEAGKTVKGETTEELYEKAATLLEEWAAALRARVGVQKKRE